MRCGVLPFLQGDDGSVEDFFGGPLGGDGHEQVFALVESGERQGAFVVSVHSHANGFGKVILTLDERTAAGIADAAHLRRAAINVVNRFASRTGAASAQARNDLVNGQLVAQDGLELNVVLDEAFIKCLGLRRGAREAIEKKPAATAEAAASLDQESKNDFVGHEIAAAHIFEGAGHGGGAIAVAESFCAAKNVTGGEVAGAKAGGKQFGLGALADAGRAEKYEAVGMSVRLRGDLALGITAFEPGVAVGIFMSCCHKQ